jgi:hypothetical protein
MPSWKKVLVSGSSIEIAAITASAVPTGTTENVVLVNSNGQFRQITQASLSAALGQYAFSGSADTGTAAVISSGDTFRVIGGGGIATSFGKSGTTGSVTVNVNSGSMLPFYSSSIFARVSGDITITAGGVATIAAGAVAISTDVSGLGTNVATALGNAVGSAGSFVVNGGVLGTPSSATLSNATGLPISTGVSGLGTGVATALGTNIGSAGSVIINGGALGTPSSATLSNATGLPISTGVSGLGTGIATFLATPSSANLASAVTDETGTGALVFAGSPTFTGTANFASIATTGNVTVAGDLNVAGTASFTNTTSVLVADKFMLLASGSTTLADGGIIIQNAAGGVGTAFYLEATSTGTFGRFAVTGSLAAGASTATPDEYMVTVKADQASAPSAAPTFGGSVNGSGNMWTTTGGDIYIYS